VPVGWDRDARLAGACIVSADGSAAAWAVIGEDAILSARVPMEAGLAIATVQESGTFVLGVVDGAVLRVWSIASYRDHRELGAAPAERIAFARWRPGGSQIVVAVADRLEIWPSAGGDRRVVARGLPSASALLVSVDGQIAVLTTNAGRSAIAVDIDTGKTAVIPLAGEQLVATISFR
jgi:tricorn protease-like protein